MVTKAPDLQQHPQPQTHNETETDQPTHPNINEANSLQTLLLSTHHSDQQGKKIERGEGGGGEDNGGEPGSDHAPRLIHHPNGWGKLLPSQYYVPQRQ